MHESRIGHRSSAVADCARPCERTCTPGEERFDADSAQMRFPTSRRSQPLRGRTDLALGVAGAVDRPDVMTDQGYRGSIPPISRSNNHDNLRTEFTIKPLEIQEVASVAALFEMQLAEHDVRRTLDELAAGLKTLLVEPEQGFVLSAVSGGNPVGVAYAARILSLEHGGWSGWLDELYVSPLWRGQGVGSALLAGVIAAAADRGWAALDLEVDSNHRRVIPLYARNRFQPVHRTRFVRRLNAE